MIEIIREEDWEHTQEKTLPKDIRQIGRPDIGDRIYVEDQAYHFLHPYENYGEKTAYVLLGRFENYSGRQCTFVETAIRLEEVAFEGDLPLWSDNTWAYIYKQLKREYDSMVIVGWAMDIKGQLANMTSRMETLHQSNFGGNHQILFLMDSLEREEAFYGSRNGKMSRREGFYIYYDKNQHAGLSQPVKTETSFVEDENEWEKQAEERAAQRNQTETETPLDTEEKIRGEKWLKGEFGERFFRERLREKGGNYRKQVAEREERKGMPSYASTLVLLAVVCVLGFVAYTNYQKMNAMEETLARMNGENTVTAEQTETSETEGVTVENVVGNIEKQEGTADGQAAENGAGANSENALQSSEIGNNAANGAEALNGTGGAASGADSGTGAASTGGADGETGTALTGGADGGTGITSTGGADSGTGTVSTGGADSGTGTSAEKAAIENGTATGADVAGAVMTEAQTYLAQGYYMVQKGDTLVSICKKIYQTTAMMDKLCEANDIKDQDAIYAGQKLILP